MLLQDIGEMGLLASTGLAKRGHLVGHSRDSTTTNSSAKLCGPVSELRTVEFGFDEYNKKPMRKPVKHAQLWPLIDPL